MKIVCGLAAALALASGTTAWAHGDIVPYEESGKIVTGSFDHDEVYDPFDPATYPIEEYERVFGYDFGEDPGNPFVIEDPGVNNDGTVGGLFNGKFGKTALLPSSNFVTFSVIDTLGHNLLYWDGSGPVLFGPAPNLVELGLESGGNELLVSANAVTGTSPSLATGASGRLHTHLESLLYFDGETTDDANNAPNGVYLLGMKLLASNSGLESDPIYLVNNNGLSEALHDAAIGWVQTNVVPEPSTAIMAAMALAGLIGFRRRKRAC